MATRLPQAAMDDGGRWRRNRSRDMSVALTGRWLPGISAPLAHIPKSACLQADLSTVRATANATCSAGRFQWKEVEGPNQIGDPREALPENCSVSVRRAVIGSPLVGVVGLGSRSRAVRAHHDHRADGRRFPGCRSQDELRIATQLKYKRLKPTPHADRPPYNGAVGLR